MPDPKSILDAINKKLKAGIGNINADLPGGNSSSIASRLGLSPLEAAALAATAGTGAATVGAVSKLPMALKLALAGAGVYGANKAGVFGGGGGSSGGGSGLKLDLSQSLPGLPASQQAATTGGDPMDALLQMLAASGAGGGGGGGGGVGRVDTAADWYNAETSRFNAETDRLMTDARIADLMYQRTVQEAQLALQRGDLQLAREKFEDSKVWSARAADAQDEANRLSGIGRQIDAYGTMGDLQLGAMGIQNQAYGKAGDLTNDAAGLQLRGLTDAGQLELAGYGTQGDILGNAGDLGVKNFSAVEDAILGRGNLTARGAENYSNLTGILGNLGAAQAELALKIATTPRNAIAGFLMGRGQDGGMASMFNPSNILGIDTATIQSVINQALQAAGQVGQLPAMQQFDVNGILQGMIGAANNAASSASSSAAGIRGAANAAPGNIAGDVSALRAVGAGAPGAIQGAVSGLGNAAAAVANKAPATIPAAPTSMAPYQATLNQMIAQGAPQAAIDMYRNNITSAGYGA